MYTIKLLSRKKLKNEYKQISTICQKKWSPSFDYSLPDVPVYFYAPLNYK